MKTSIWNTLNGMAEAIRAGGLRVLLWGEKPGTGKSSWAMRKWGDCVERYTLHQRVEPFDLLYDISLVNGNTVRTDGPVIRAMKSGSPFVLDELDAHSPAVRCLLQQVLDDPEICQVTLPDGQRIRPAPGFCVIGTSNAPPTTLHPALADRFDVQIHVGAPEDSAFAALPKGVREMLKNVYAAETQNGRAFSLRSALSFTRLARAGIANNVAAVAVFGENGSEFLSAAKIAE